jgi:hypothetical protein
LKIAKALEIKAPPYIVRHRRRAQIFHTAWAQLRPPAMSAFAPLFEAKRTLRPSRSIIATITMVAA